MRLVFSTFTIVLVNSIAISALIIPDELPSILSIIYSNIPTLKKGTDSRVGWGFRLGDRADFQVLTEFGPQIYTQKLANQEDGEGGNSKRNTLDTLANTLYAQRQLEKNTKELEKKEKQQKTEGAAWLQKWSKSVTKPSKKIQLENAKPGLGIGEIDAKSVIPEEVGDAVGKINEKTEAPLDDVSLD